MLLLPSCNSAENELKEIGTINHLFFKRYVCDYKIILLYSIDDTSLAVFSLERICCVSADPDQNQFTIAYGP